MAHPTSLTRRALMGGLVLTSIYGLYEMRIRPALSGWNDRFGDAVMASRFPERPDIVLRRTFTNVQGIDIAFSHIVSAFMVGAAGLDDKLYIQQAYFLLGFFPLLAIFSLESRRDASRGRWANYPWAWAIFYQTVAGAAIVPLFCLSFVLGANTGTPQAISIRASKARALLPALLLGYFLPTLAIYLPSSLHTTTNWVIVWQFTPFYVDYLIHFFSKAYKKSDESATEPALHQFYGFCLSFSVIMHYVVLYMAISNNVSLVAAFVPRASLLDGSIFKGLLYIFQADYVGCCLVPPILWALITHQDMVHAGHVSSGVMSMAVSLVVACVVTGPAAAFVGFWWWRESVLRSKNVAGKSK